MLNYGYHKDALRIAEKFCGTIREIWENTGKIYEKYDVHHVTSDSQSIKFGYSENVEGFGWTNGTLIRLLDIIEKIKTDQF